ncbi:TrmH family RNA methyltransferase [Anatilimnocola floriformis]|uniref:TrmH family RNA methyltransferase n=1 Tax=Anatilimnocola floriformis TaxID=2948575 RepID=UPI0020C58616|nr:RNA methyltransferase [Anatilimnocola floriformis]
MLPPISSLQNPRIKQAIKLRDRHGRDDQRRIILDGRREIERALAAGVQLTELFIEADVLSPEDEKKLVRNARNCGADVLDVSALVMQKLAFGERHEGIVATAKVPDSSLTAFAAVLAKRSTPPLIAIVEGLEKPGNLGAILRTADAAGVSGLIVCAGRTDLYNPNAIRASLGAIFTVPVAAANRAETLNFVKQQQLKVFAARVDGAVDYAAVDYRVPCAIVLGSEAEGLTREWHTSDVQAIRLPMQGKVDSLNVSVTAGVIFYEALRQRGN